jgi:hypothetical protein
MILTSFDKEKSDCNFSTIQLQKKEILVSHTRFKSNDSKICNPDIPAIKGDDAAPMQRGGEIEC